jgi:cyclopropane fatty-acyl-phospholipid synthase-like methyltransferase
MLLERVQSWFGGGVAVAEPPRAAAPASQPEPPRPPEREAAWPPERVAVAEQLWGEGFLFPGGAEETLRLAKPLGLSSAASLLLIGAGAGGPPCTLAAQLGVWVTGFEADPDLAALAQERAVRARLGRRAQVEMWYPSAPAFRARAFHHGLALEPLRGGKAEPVLAALTAALKPGGQFVMLELVADEPLDPADPAAGHWARLERRSLELPSETSVTRMLGRLGYEVRVAEDMTQRHMHLAVLGWRQAVRAMAETKPTAAEAARLVAEAEIWLLRLRLMRERKLRLLRWHAIGPRRELG